MIPDGVLDLSRLCLVGRRSLDLYVSLCRSIHSPTVFAPAYSSPMTIAAHTGTIIQSRMRHIQVAQLILVGLSGVRRPESAGNATN
jgi:hypothetical protein